MTPIKPGTSFSSAKPNHLVLPQALLHASQIPTRCPHCSPLHLTTFLPLLNTAGNTSRRSGPGTRARVLDIGHYQHFEPPLLAGREAVFCTGGCLIASLSPTYTAAPSPTVVTTKNDSRHCQCFLRGKTVPLHDPLHAGFSTLRA